MEKFDFEKFGIKPCSIEEAYFNVRVGSSLFKVYNHDFMNFVRICLGSGLDVFLESFDNEFLKF